MKKLLILSVAAILILCSVSLMAQTEKRIVTPPKGSKVNLNIKNATVHVEGYDGDDIIFETHESAPATARIPAGAVGLKDISPLTPNTQNPGNFWSWGGDVLKTNSRILFTTAGPRDRPVININSQAVNTGGAAINISSAKVDSMKNLENVITIASSPVVSQSGGYVVRNEESNTFFTATSSFARTNSQVIEGINPVMKETASGYTITLDFNSIREIFIKVPKSIHLRLSSISYIGSPETSVKNLTGEVEITTSSANLLIDNVPGLASLFSLRTNSVTGKIVIKNNKWLESQKTTTGALRPLFITGSHDIDLSIPADLKATFTVNTPKGEIYSDLSLQKEQPTTTSALSVSLKNKYIGTLNGGGVAISIRSEYGNVLLRKAK